MPLFNLSLNEDRTWLKTIRLILACLKRWILSMDAFAGRPLILLHLHDFSILLIVNKQPFSGPFPGYVPISVLQSIGRNNFIAGAGQIPCECQFVILVVLSQIHRNQIHTTNLRELRLSYSEYDFTGCCWRLPGADVPAFDTRDKMLGLCPSGFTRLRSSRALTCSNNFDASFPFVTLDIPFYTRQRHAAAEQTSCVPHFVASDLHSSQLCLDVLGIKFHCS